MTPTLARVAVIVCALLACTGAPAVTQAPPPPKLIVVIVVDQLRSDYLQRHTASLTGGLKRLLTAGAVFADAAYPYLNTVTCAGHSTIGTGAFPYRHGMILNAWYDRAAGASTSCTTDPTARDVSYLGLKGSAHSARRLLVPTLADGLRESARGRVVSISQKARSAIGMAGHGGDAVIWFDERGDWVTSSAYTEALAPFVRSFLERNPLAADYGKSWTRLLPADAYTGSDDVAQERPPTSWSRMFPHVLESPSGKPDGTFYSVWARSPFADDYLRRMAEDAADALKLGRGEGTDFLAVSFSALDLVGHAFGPASHEVQDVVLRLDRTLGALLDHLDRTVGKSNYVLALSSDHGVSPIPELMDGGGRHTSAEVRTAIDGALIPLFGPPPAPSAPPPGATAALASYMAYNAYTDTYLAAGVMDRLRKEPKALDAALDALRRMPGVSHAFSGDELARPDARSHSDPVRRAAALSYLAERSGDIIMVPKPNWILSTSAATHGTLHEYDSRVPVIFYGAGVAAGTHGGVATPADIAPTLAALAHVPFGASDGRILTGALAASPKSK